MKRNAPTLSDTLNKLRKIMPAIGQSYRVRSLAVFGSVARDEADTASDIDLLTFIELEEYLRQQLSHPVELIPRCKLKPELRSKILREAVSV